MLSLPPDERKELRDALLHAFDLVSFDRLLLTRLGVSRDDYVAVSGLKEVITAVLEAFQREGKVQDLIRAAVEARPGDAYIRRISPDIRTITNARIP